MSKVLLYPTHNTLSFSGRKIKPIYAKSINDLMYQFTALDGAYKYEIRSNDTIFTIYPECSDFGDDPSDIKDHLETYKAIYEYVVSKNPDCIDF